MSAFTARVSGAACETATGGRDCNQDRCEALWLDPSESLWGFRAAIVVADGMGGHERGDQAADLAARAAREVLAARLEDHAEFAADFPGAEPEDVVRGAFERANQQIYEWAVTQDVIGDTGTTLTVIACTDEEVVVGNVGDSRAYVVSGGAVRKVSEDHSWVGQQVRLGNLTEAEAAASPLRNQLTQAVGCDAAVEPHIVALPLEPGAAYVACTDGLTEVVDADAILEVVQAGGVPEDLCRALVALAVAAGTSDNVTVAALCTDPAEALVEAAPAPPPAPEPDLPPLDETVVLVDIPVEPEAGPGPSPEPTPEPDLAPGREPEEAPEEAPAPVRDTAPAASRQRGQRLGAALIVCILALAVGLLAGRATIGPAPPAQPAEVAPTLPETSASPVDTTPVETPPTPEPVDAAPTGAVIVEVKCEGDQLIVTGAEELALDVYPKGKYRDSAARLAEVESQTPGETRFRLPEPEASWEGQSVALTVERPEAGTLSLSLAPDGEAFVDQKPFSGEALKSVKPEGSRARLGFYFPSGDDADAYAIAIVGFPVEG
jgi:protein phosphatase